MPGDYPQKIKSLPLYDGRFDAYQLSADNCKVLFASYPPGTKIPSHAHDTENHGVITKGELVLIMDGIEQRIKAGEWYHVPAHCEHAAYFEVETDEVEFWFDA